MVPVHVLAVHLLCRLRSQSLFPHLCGVHGDSHPTVLWYSHSQQWLVT